MHKSFSDTGIDDQIAFAAEWIAETHLNAMEAMRVNNERLIALNMLPRVIPVVEREIRSRGCEDEAREEVELYESLVCGEDCDCSQRVRYRDS